jgi:hypothetical protein
MLSPDHIEHPYPSEDEKIKIMKETGLELKQLTNWFVNNRKRYWRPKVDELREQSESCDITLQEAAARAQESNGSLSVAQIALKNSSTVVSSEGEESSSSSSSSSPGRKGSKSTTAKKQKMVRRKYSTLGEHDDDKPGIHTAKTHAAIKAAMQKKSQRSSSKASRKKMRRLVSEISSSEAESDGEHRDPPPHPATPPLLDAEDTIFNDPIVNTTCDDHGRELAASALASTAAPVTPIATKEFVEDLDYSISPVDTVICENISANISAMPTAGAGGATMAANNAVLSCSNLPHSCNSAADSAKVRYTATLQHV